MRGEGGGGGWGEVHWLAAFPSDLKRVVGERITDYAMESMYIWIYVWDEYRLHTEGEIPTVCAQNKQREAHQVTWQCIDPPPIPSYLVYVQNKWLSDECRRHEVNKLLSHRA